MFIQASLTYTCKRFLFLSLQFDEEFSARQEAQAESQKKDEKIKELEEKIQALESQVDPITLQNTSIFPARNFLMHFFRNQNESFVNHLQKFF